MSIFKKNNYKGKNPLTKDEKIKCHSIIHGASVAAGAAGVVPIGPADALMITPIQIGMIGSLGVVFNIKVDENLAKSILGGLAMCIAGRQAAALALTFIPLVGWVIKGATATLLTEAIGWSAVAHFKYVKERKEDKEIETVSKVGKEYEEKFKNLEKQLRNKAKEFLEMKNMSQSKLKELESFIDRLCIMLIAASNGENAETTDVKERISILQELLDILRKKSEGTLQLK